VRLQLERGPRLNPQSFAVSLKKESISPRDVMVATPLAGC